ncbi:MAG TPA: HEAT repeat domain-containing protein [Polyangiaceae bacterium]
MLGLHPLPRTIGAALRDIEHQREHVRHSSLRDLVRLAREPEHRASALAALERTLQKDQKSGLRVAAALGLADAEAHESRAALLAALDDRELEVRQFALLALGEIAPLGDVEVAGRLRALAQASDAALRFQALVALDRVAPETSEPALERAASDSDDEVRAMAFRILARRPAAGRAPAWVTDKALAALSGTAPAVSAAAALLLAEHGDRRAEPVIVGVLDGSVAAPSDDVQSAIEFAAELGLERARPALQKRAFAPWGLRSNPLAWHACVALARLGDERARRAILKRLHAWSFDARTLAVAAAGQARLVEARSRIESFRRDPSLADPDAVAEALRALGAPD